LPTRTFGRFSAAVFAGWIVLIAAAAVYAQRRGIASAAAIPAALAFLVEFPFYILPAFRGPREWLAAQPKWRAALLLTLSSLLPWAVLSIATGTVNRTGLLVLLLTAIAISFWYVVLPVCAWADALLLVLIAGLQISKIFEGVYPPLIPRQSLSILGHLMLIRTAALAFLVLRGGDGVSAEFRFLPTRAEWGKGFGYFAVMLPVVGAVYWALGLVNLRPQPLGAPLAIGTFFGVLWVVALSEEFFLRGLLQKWLEDWTRSPTAALVIASVISGAAHLGFRFHGAFPSWRFALVALVFHSFCGLAWMRNRTIQVGMVAHALTVTVWEVFFH
jgi:membrane protease YdiL (CAAX protease family)